jgi:quercetin dioxygenase-like cupin family protein
MEAEMKIGRMLLAAASAFWTIAMAHGAAGATVDSLGQPDTGLSVLPADHPTGPGAIITRLNTKRAAGLNNPTLSTFVVDYPPGGSAVLHRMPSSGYILIYVLSGTIRASAWHAGVGTYRAGEMWVEPAFAHDIAATNQSPDESARILVVLVTGSQEPDSANDATLAE